ncbi:MAG: hypothetical protein RIF42_03595, partial [Parvibaculaceae bacterium]
AAAAANRSIFYGKNGEARTADEVYRNLVAKHEGTDATRIAELAQNARLSSNRHENVTNRSGVLTDLAGGDNRRSYATRGASLPSTGPSTGMSTNAQTTSYGRSPLKLTPGVVEILASLDPIPEGSESLRTERTDAREAAEERREAHRERAGLLPHSGFTYG